LYVKDVSRNPPGYYLDESSISYNAYLISRTGASRYGVHWPLYFQYDARGVNLYGGPYVYLLSIVFSIFPPSIFLARSLSATLGFVTALLLGQLASKISRQASVGIVVALSTVLTPWLFEISRIVLEPALYQLALVLFLLALYRAHTHSRWSLLDRTMLGVTLALITYTYAIGKLVGPAFALGLVIFASGRKRLLDIIKTWVGFALALLPLLIFNLQHPGVLQSRFQLLTYITPQSTIRQILAEFIRRYLQNLNAIHWVYVGDGNPRHHVPGAMGSLLGATVIIAIIGAFLVLIREWRNPWWRYVLFALAVSLAPGALTKDNFHALREIGFPIFLLLLNIPALAWLLGSERKVDRTERDEGSWAASFRSGLCMALMVLTVLQGSYFQVKFRQQGPSRGYAFESDFAQVFAAATALPSRPIYLVGEDATIGAYWYATAQGRSTAEFVEVPAGATPPREALTIRSETPSASCLPILRYGHYILCLESSMKSRSVGPSTPRSLCQSLFSHPSWLISPLSPTPLTSFATG
jgi:dolichyl-phosphate-mannose-protein mannosyltransferase